MSTSQDFKRYFRNEERRWRWWLFNDAGKYTPFTTRNGTQRVIRKKKIIRQRRGH